MTRFFGGAAAAIAACVLLSVPLLLWPVGLRLAPERDWMPGPPSLVLVVLIALLCALAGPLLGIVLLLKGRRTAGAGLITGWALLGLATSGWCVGLAPDFYDPGRQYRQFTDQFSLLPEPTADQRAAQLINEVGAHGQPAKTVRRSGCWAYARRQLVQPPGAGWIEYETTLATGPGQALPAYDRLARELGARHHSIGRPHEALFVTGDGFEIRLATAEGDAGVTVNVRTPCLHLLS